MRIRFLLKAQNNFPGFASSFFTYTMKMDSATELYGKVRLHDGIGLGKFRFRVFTREHVTTFSKISTLGSVVEKLHFQRPSSPDTCELRKVNPSRKSCVFMKRKRVRVHIVDNFVLFSRIFGNFHSFCHCVLLASRPDKIYAVSIFRRSVRHDVTAF